MVEETETPLVESQAKPKSFFERFAVAIVFCVFVTFRALDRVFLKDVNNALARSSYNLVWSNIIWPLAIQIMTICILLAYVAAMRWQGNKEYTWRFFLPGNKMASSLGPVPMWQLALFSIGDQLNAALSAPASPFVTQPIQSVMTNSVLIWMAIMAFFWIGARYQQVHYLGIALVMMSILVQISSKVTSNDCSIDGMRNGDCFSSYKDANGKYIMLTISQMSVWYILFFVSTLPAAWGNVYKQVILQRRDVDVVYATWWSGNFQVLWGWLFLPLIWIPLPGQEVLGPGATFSEIGKTLSCLSGHMPRPDDFTCASSPPPYFWVIVYLCFNVSFNLALLWLTKRMSAAWAQVATVLCLNLCSIFSQFKFAAGDSAEWMSLNDWLGLIVASMALWAYNLAPEVSDLQPASGGGGCESVADSIIKAGGSHKE